MPMLSIPTFWPFSRPKGFDSFASTDVKSHRRDSDGSNNFCAAREDTPAAHMSFHSALGAAVRARGRAAVGSFGPVWARYARRVHSSWRMAETAVSVRGGAPYLSRAVDKHGKTVDSLLCT